MALELRNKLFLLFSLFLFHLLSDSTADSVFSSYIGDVKVNFHHLIRDGKFCLGLNQVWKIYVHYVINVLCLPSIWGILFPFPTNSKIAFEIVRDPTLWTWTGAHLGLPSSTISFVFLALRYLKKKADHYALNRRQNDDDPRNIDITARNIITLISYITWTLPF